MLFEAALLILLWLIARETANVVLEVRATNRAAQIERLLRRLKRMHKRPRPQSLALDGLRLSPAEQCYVHDMWPHSDACPLTFTAAADGRGACEVRWDKACAQ